METNTDIGSMEVATRSGISTNTLNDNFLKMTRETTSTTLRRSRPSHTWAKIYSCLNTHTRGGELPVSFSHGHVLMQCTRRRGRHRLASHFLPLSLPQGGKDACSLGLKQREILLLSEHSPYWRLCNIILFLVFLTLKQCIISFMERRNVFLN